MPEPKTIACDIDGVVADTLVPWIDFYNRDYEDDLDVGQLVEWDIHVFVKPECGLDIYRYIRDPALYDHVHPVDGALDGIGRLRSMGHRIVFATAAEIETSGRKFEWLLDHGFGPDQADYIEAADKSLIRADLMIDDRYRNVVGFVGPGILFDRPWNSRHRYAPRASSWPEVVEMVESIDSSA